MVCGGTTKRRERERRRWSSTAVSSGGRWCDGGTKRETGHRESGGSWWRQTAAPPSAAAVVVAAVFRCSCSVGFCLHLVRSGQQHQVWLRLSCGSVRVRVGHGQRLGQLWSTTSVRSFGSDAGSSQHGHVRDSRFMVWVRSTIRVNSACRLGQNPSQLGQQ
ncbi:hypothetical protein Hanom_Chr13g01203211 [Helianthus anomalus]